MRAWRVEAAGEPAAVLACVGDAELPDPGPGQIRMRVEAAGVGLPDLLMCRNQYPLTPPLPFTPGQEAVGTVLAVGENAGVRVGDRVMAVSCFYLGYGSFAEECLAGGDFALDAPDSMSAAEAAAFLIPFHTAYVALVRRAALQRGETLLVLGAAGGTGSAALQLGKVLGARVIAVAAGAEKTSFCAGLGADIVIDRRTTDIAAAVREATGGRGADCVYDPVSGDAFHAATRCIAPEGRLLLIGFASGKWATPELWPIVSGNFSVVGVFPGGYSREFRENAQTFLLDRWYKGDLRVPIYRTLPFECAREAVALLARGEVMGKVVVDGAL